MIDAFDVEWDPRRVNVLLLDQFVLLEGNNLFLGEVGALCTALMVQELTELELFDT